MAFQMVDPDQGISIHIISSNTMVPMDPYPNPLKMTYTDPPVIVTPGARPASGQLWPRGVQTG